MHVPSFVEARVQDRFTGRDSTCTLADRRPGRKPDDDFVTVIQQDATDSRAME